MPSPSAPLSTSQRADGFNKPSLRQYLKRARKCNTVQVPGVYLFG
jgi:hypothetical protein